MVCSVRAVMLSVPSDGDGVSGGRSREQVLAVREEEYEWLTSPFTFRFVEFGVGTFSSEFGVTDPSLPRAQINPRTSVVVLDGDSARLQSVRRRLEAEGVRRDDRSGPLKRSLQAPPNFVASTSAIRRRLAERERPSDRSHQAQRE